MVNFENPEISTSYVKEKELVENVYLVEDGPFLNKNKIEKSNFKTFFIQKKDGFKRRFLINKEIQKGNSLIELPNLITDSLRKKISELLAKNNYDAVLVTYSYWADIASTFIKEFPLVKRVIDPTDFLTLQQFYGHGKIGNMFEDEVERMSRFNDIIHISYDEYLLFSNFIPHSNHYFIPQFFEPVAVNNLNKTKEFDILFIGSRNPYNQEGINWFLNEVYPLLESSIKIGIAGTICNEIHFEADNITMLGFVNDVASLYNICTCTICPLKRGSGMKIKVIESLAYGLPVVSTYKGLDGFYNKQPDGGILIANTPPEFAKCINLLISDKIYYKKQSEIAGELFESNFSAKGNYLKLDQIFGISTKD